MTLSSTPTSASALLGHALSLRAGMTTYDALVSDRILRPLGMTDTAVTLTPRMRAHLVRGHDRGGDPVANWDLSALAGMGGLRSTANDMLTFAAANLSPEDTDLTLAMRLAHRALRQAEGFAYPGIPIAFNEGRVGFNWFISRPGERRITWTVGLTGGYSSFLGLDIEARRAVVVLTNTGLNNVDYLGFHLLDPTVGVPRQARSDVGAVENRRGAYAASMRAQSSSARIRLHLSTRPCGMSGAHPGQDKSRARCPHSIVGKRMQG